MLSKYVAGYSENRYNVFVEEGSGLEENLDGYNVDNTFFLPMEVCRSVFVEAANIPEFDMVNA